MQQFMSKMNKIVSILVFLISFVLCKSFFVENLKLKQIFILSRHNVRTPVGEGLHRYSPKLWPSWGSPGLLTPRGAQMEGYMGEYISEWLKREHLLSEGCPDEDAVYVYANTLNRTIETARAFIDSAFKSCNVSVHHKNTTEWDPVFQSVIHNTTDAFKDMVFQKISSKLQKNNATLQAIYAELNKILEIEESEICKQDGICDLTKANDTIVFPVGKAVTIAGPFYVSYKSIDAFTMNYYNGLPTQDIAWGHITTPEKWQFLTEICRLYQDIRYRTIGKYAAAPLMEYVTKVFMNYDEMPKIMLVFGHASNMNFLANALGFKLIDLPNTYEKFPIGGKFVFQRWTDSKNDYLKIEYVYPSWSQLRNGSKYSWESPPQRVVMRLKWCNTDERGFCSWEKFINKF